MSAITRLRNGAPVVRETDVFERTDPVVIALYPKYLSIRVKGSAETFQMSYAKLLSYARGLAIHAGVSPKTAR